MERWGGSVAFEGGRSDAADVCNVRTFVRLKHETTLELRKAVNSEEKDVLNLKKHICKLVANTYFGLNGCNGSSTIQNACFNATTCCGRVLVQNTKRKFEELGCDVLYGDTDSLFVKQKKEGQDQFHKDVFELNESFRDPIHLEFEQLGDAIFFRKKSYAIRNVETGQVQYVGTAVNNKNWGVGIQMITRTVIESIFENSKKTQHDIGVAMNKKLFELLNGKYANTLSLTDFCHSARNLSSISQQDVLADVKKYLSHIDIFNCIDLDKVIELL